jgi:soluble lytic murein transglycosylase-like protein
MGWHRRAGLVLGALSAVALSGWLMRWGAARAHTMAVARIAPQATSRDPAQLAPQVRSHADVAGVNQVLLMAILYNESYKPHGALLERAWQLLHRDSAFGVANMHRRTYERTRFGRPFDQRAWKELPDDPELAIQAAAWHLHDLHNRLPDTTSGSFTRDELLAMGYNAGARNMLRFAAGRQPGPRARAYVDRLREHWEPAERAVQQDGA